MTIKDSMPAGLYRTIAEYLKSNCDEKAKTSWKRNKSKEDAITGAFFEGITKSDSSFSEEPDWHWSIDYNSFSARKEEPHLGADGLFQIEVRNKQTGETLKKGFLFQSKKHYNVEKQETQNQLRNMERHVKGSGLLLTYDGTGFDALTATSYLSNPGNWKNEKRDFGSFISTDFLNCSFGVQGLHYDFAKREIVNGTKEIPITPEVVSTIKVIKEK